MMKYKILDILRGLMAQQSITNTEREIAAETWIHAFFRRLPYFRDHPERCGLFPVQDDPLRRNVVWALVTTGGQPSALPTVIFMGHHDVVSADVYGEALPWAFDPDTIAGHLAPGMLSPEAYTDLLSGEWIFGRGSCDMLGGTAAQMAVLAEQADAVLAGRSDAALAGQEDETAGGIKNAPEEPVDRVQYGKSKKAGALLFLSVPDEETFSAGMRGSLLLLEQLKEKYGLDYRLAVCGEPNRRLADGKTQVIHSGSIGKLLPVVLVQGRMVQIGSYRDGVNPLGILSRIVAATEGDEEFTETCEGEASVPPVWMYARDLKEGYDFSLPRQAAGYCNVLTFRKTPAQVMAYFLAKIKAAAEKERRDVSVMTWVTLWQQAKQKEGFAGFYREMELMIPELLYKEKQTFPEITLRMMRRTLEFLQLDQPLVLFGFAPPYYPAVRSEEMRNAERFAVYKKAAEALQQVTVEPYFPGVSDCSYCGLAEGAQGSLYRANTPLWGKGYSFDTEAPVRLQIPFFLWGPWGKDLHQAGERVNRYSLTEEYPSVLRKLLQCVWLSK